MTPRPKVLAITRRIERLEAINRSRALTAEEAAELERLLFDQRRRSRRLPIQIAATEAKLLRLRAEQLALS